MYYFFTAVSSALVISFCVYVLTILIPFLRRKPQEPGNPDEFRWHFFVPCRDEEAVIGTTMTRLRDTFPQAMVWIVDDDSDDETTSIVRQRGAWDSQVRLVQRRRPEARTGKGDALNAAYAELNLAIPGDAKRDTIIVCVVDADGQLAPNALEQMAGADVFADPRVGAAQVTVHMRNRNDKHPFPDRGRLANLAARYLVRMQDIEFRTTIAAMQSLRQRTGTVGLGGNGQFTRLSALDAIKAQYGHPWHGSLLEDYELGVHVLLAGYENRHVHDTHVSQEALPDFRRFLTQRTRWSQGNIQCTPYLRQIIASPHIDNAGVLESGYYLLLPFIQLVACITWIYLIITGIVIFQTSGADISAWWATNWAAPIFLFAIGIGPFFLWGPIYRQQCEPSYSVFTGMLWGLGMWLFVFYTYITLSRAFVRVLLGKRGWAKTRRNAEVHAIGVVAKES